MSPWWLVQVFRQAPPFTVDVKQKYFGAYAQDTWRVSPRMTLNYGVRWEPWFPQQHQQGQIYNFDIERLRAGTRSQVYPQAPPGLHYAGDPGFPGNAGMYSEWANVQPRVGFAWDPFGDGRAPIHPEAQAIDDGGIGIVIEDDLFELDDHGMRLPWLREPWRAGAILRRGFARRVIGWRPIGCDSTAPPAGRAPTPAAYSTDSEIPSSPRSFSIAESASAIEQNGARPSHVATRQKVWH